MVIVLICNISLISHLLRYKRMLEIGNSSVGLSRQHLRDFTKMVILITILFYITWLPVLCVMTLVQFGINIRQSVASLCIMATSINGFVNPFVYLTLSKQYRNGYIILMAAMCKRLGIRMRCFGSDLSVLSSSTYQTTRQRESTRRQPELEENLFANNVTNL
ncbi:uncharacterized protein [Antedon mediterranea]|uniref:uncharacterized protein n=1 Tax=Antedon mediterranea TaxID=105859 RepID=UPI003AF45643